MSQDKKWAAALKRITKDMKLLTERGYPILREDGKDEDVDPTQWCTTMPGTPGTPYEGGTWRVRFTFSKDYPFTNPSVGFVDHIMHPNIDWRSGSVCLDAISKEWTPTTHIVPLIELLLANLLAMPNPGDPLNPEAARKMERDPERYTDEVRAAAKKHAFHYVEPASLAKAASGSSGSGGAAAPGPGPGPVPGPVPGSGPATGRLASSSGRA